MRGSLVKMPDVPKKFCMESCNYTICNLMKRRKDMSIWQIRWVCLLHRKVVGIEGIGVDALEKIWYDTQAENKLV